MDYLSKREIYLRRKFAFFFEGLGYVNIMVPFDARAKKQGNWYIETQMLVDNGSKKAMMFIFGKRHRESHLSWIIF